MTALGEAEIWVRLPDRDKRVAVPGRVVMDRPGREVVVATLTVYVLAWALSRASEASGELVLETIRELCGAEGRPLGHDAARDALAEAARRGYVTRRRDPGLGYVYTPTQPEPGEYCVFIDAYAWARRDVSFASRAAYAVVVAHMTQEATSRRMDGWTLSEHLGVSRRTACGHVRALTQGAAPLLTRVDITTEGQRWRIRRTLPGQSAGRSALLDAVRANHRRTPLVACWRAHPSAETPQPRIAPLYGATTNGGFVQVPVSRNTQFRRKQRPSSHQTRSLPRHSRRPEVQKRLDALWELLDAECNRGWSVASPGRIAADLCRRADLGTVCDAVHTTYALLATDADIREPLAFARSLVVCFRHPDRCRQRHYGPCGELRRSAGMARVREWTHDKLKAEMAAMPLGTEVASLLETENDKESSGWEKWHRQHATPTDVYRIDTALDALPPHLRTHPDAEAWALNVARRNTHQALNPKHGHVLARVEGTVGQRDGNGSVLLGDPARR